MFDVPADVRRLQFRETLMIVTDNPVQFATGRLKFWEKRMKSAERIPVGRGKGRWPSQASQDREIALCQGAIIALQEVIDALKSQPLMSAQ